MAFRTLVEAEGMPASFHQIPGRVLRGQSSGAGDRVGSAETVTEDRARIAQVQTGYMGNSIVPGLNLPVTATATGHGYWSRADARRNTAPPASRAGVPAGV